MRRLMKFLLVLAVIGSGLAFAQSKLPKTPVHEVTDEYFGVKVIDPYRWIENTSSPEVSMDEGAERLHPDCAGAIPGRDKLLARIKELDNAGKCCFRRAGLGRQVLLFQDRSRLR